MKYNNSLKNKLKLISKMKQMMKVIKEKVNYNFQQHKKVKHIWNFYKNLLQQQQKYANNFK